jgi:uncharacterized protein YqgC (DUF456 family)
MNKKLKTLLGILLIVIGIPGLVLPIIPGIILIILGITLLGYNKFPEYLRKRFNKPKSRKAT